jgi:hypothetical protein
MTHQVIATSPRDTKEEEFPSMPSMDSFDYEKGEITETQSSKDQDLYGNKISISGKVPNGSISIVSGLTRMDKALSKRIQHMVLNPYLEYFIFVMASAFNRAKALWTLPTYGLLGLIFHERIYSLIGEDNSNVFKSSQVHLFFFTFFHYGLTLLFETLFIVILKKTI